MLVNGGRLEDACLIARGGGDEKRKCLYACMRLRTRTEGPVDEGLGIICVDFCLLTKHCSEGQFFFSCFVTYVMISF